MKKTSFVLFLFPAGAASACPMCNPQVRDAISRSGFFPNLFIMLSAFVVLALIVLILVAVANKRHLSRTAAGQDFQPLSPVPMIAASMVLGIGFGGFIDGIVFHQVLQVHEMLSNKIPATDYVGKSVNMFWDGIFHAFCLLVSFIGVLLLWKLSWRKNIDRSGWLLTAGLLIGWGTFNLVEGVLDHHVLRLHNVVEYAVDRAPANLAFLGVSVVLILIGWGIIARENKKRYVAAQESMHIR